MDAKALGRLAITIPGTPVAKPRQTQRDKWKPSEPVQRYRAWADQLKWTVRQHMRSRGPMTGALELSAVFYLPIPGCFGVAARSAVTAGEYPHTEKPDLKNLIAGLEDALNGIAWWDDAQICQYGRCLKVYDDGCGPRTVLLAYRVGQAPDIKLADLKTVEVSKDR